jgi:hypothetical protein
MRWAQLTAAWVTGVFLVIVASAAAAPSHYFPKPHHACKAGYVRKTVKVREHKRGKLMTVKRAECVLKRKPSRTPTSTDMVTSLESNYNSDGTITDYFPVSGTVYNQSTGQEMRGLPMTYTITDNTTLQVVGSFSETSNIGATCSVVTTLSNGGNGAELRRAGRHAVSSMQPCAGQHACRRRAAHHRIFRWQL